MDACQLTRSILCHIERKGYESETYHTSTSLILRDIIKLYFGKKSSDQVVVDEIAMFEIGG